jgi:hypothetical protein
MSYRDDVAALAARKAALDAQLRQLTRERDEVAALLAVPVLEKRNRTRTIVVSTIAVGLFAGGVGVAIASQAQEGLGDDSNTGCFPEPPPKTVDPCRVYMENLDRLVDSIPEAARRPLLDSKIELLKLNADDPRYADELCAKAVLTPFEQPYVPDGICVDDRRRPSTCESYVSAMKTLAACAPVESRQPLRDSANQMMMALHQLPPLSTRQAEDACATALEGIEEALASMCEPPEPAKVIRCERLAPQWGVHLLNSSALVDDNCESHCSSSDD